MRQTIFLTILFAFFILLAGCMQNANDPQKMVTAADKLDEQFIKAYNDRDVDALMATYWNSSELVSCSPTSMFTKGWDNVKAAMQEEFKNAPEFKLELLDHNNRAEGNVVIGTGTFRYTIMAPNSEPVVINGRFTDVKLERDGKWVYVVDHASVPLPPPSDQK